VGERPGVQIPLGGLWLGQWNASVGQGGEQGLVIPDVGRRCGRWSTDEWQRRPSIVGLIGWSAATWAEDTCPRDVERHGPGLNHAYPWVHTGRPPSVRWPSRGV
jgi:hypothetical protein